MAWMRIIFQTSKNVKKIERLLEDLGCVAISFFDAKDEPILEPQPGETPMWNQAKVEALFDDSIEIMPIVNELWKIQSSLEIFYERVLEQNWQNSWQSHFEAKHFKRFSIYPEGANSEKKTIPVFIVPGLAFGTGNHETTNLCLEWLDTVDVSQKDVIDFGCGSGILAIAAQKLGALNVWATDHDPQALTSSDNNAKLNSIEGNKLKTCLPENMPINLCADFILANILANPLIDLAPKFKKMLKPGGKIVVSGLLATQIDMVKEAYSSWLENIECNILGDWASISGQRL
jgi:ribosomal protein L11 methyltransferase